MRTRLGSLLVLVGSCGPAGTDATGTEPTSAATSSTTSLSSTDALTSTSPTTGAETGDATSTGVETGAETGVETGEASATTTTTDTTASTTGESSTGESTGESSTGEPAGVVYIAKFNVGQINRISVHRADFDADNCAVLHLSEDGADPNMPVILPPFWKVEWTHVAQGTSSCFGDEVPLAWEQADSVMGVADFDPAMACEIDVDVTATFPQTEPWVPMEIHFLATDLPIQGSC